MGNNSNQYQGTCPYCSHPIDGARDARHNAGTKWLRTCPSCGRKVRFHGSVNGGRWEVRTEKHTSWLERRQAEAAATRGNGGERHG